MYFTNLVVLPEKYFILELFINNFSDSISIDLFNPSSIKPCKIINTKSECDKPLSIAQSIWRDSLPIPNYSRIYSDVKNIIIHHSATDILSDNYTNIIRNIYLYHTQTLQWSDIGYNYIIAPDGTIFNGRDPGLLKQDEVVGAHFCGQNSSTLGICLLGNFEKEEPSQQALTSLINLCTWKCGKELLNPKNTNNHTLNSSLPVIAGHLDGCATLCPGTNLYFKLNEIRDSTYLQLFHCNLLPTITSISSNNSNFQPFSFENNIITIYENFTSAILYTIKGNILQYCTVNNIDISIYNEPIIIIKIDNNTWIIKKDN